MRHLSVVRDTLCYTDRKKVSSGFVTPVSKDERGGLSSKHGTITVFFKHSFMVYLLRNV